MKTPLMIVLGLAVAVGCASAQERVDRRIETSATGSLDIVNTAGSVRVVGWDRSEIQVTGTLGRGTERLEVTEGRIRVVLPNQARNVRGSDLEIRVPVRKDLHIQTVSADIGVAGVSGFVTARAVSGDIDVAGSPAEVGAHTTSGDVRVRVDRVRLIRAASTSGTVEVRGTADETVIAESVSGDVEVETTTPDLRAKSVSGSVDLNGRWDRVTVSTVSGDAMVASPSVQFASVESVSGSLGFTGSLEPRANARLESHSGDIVLSLPADVAADFEVRSFSGDIDNAFGPEARRASRYGPGRELDFSTGNGGARVSVRTFSGSVKLVRR